MDSKNRRTQALGAGAVAVFLVAGVALGADALLRTPNPKPVVSLTGDQFAAPALGVQGEQLGATPEPTTTPEPTRAPVTAGASKAGEPASSTRGVVASGLQKASETPEPTETPEASDDTSGTSAASSEDDDANEQGDGDAPATTGGSPVRTPEPTHAPGSGDAGGQD
jgi:hypothetical protein